MKRWFKGLHKLRVRKVDIGEISDRALLVNLYGTQALTLIIGMIILAFQGRSLFELLKPPVGHDWLYIATIFAGVVLLVDLLISRWVSEDMTDDGGVNERIFRQRPLWHVLLLSMIVAICEEVLFRGAIQHAWGAYWTSVFFAAIHVRYLRHWLLTGLVFSISYGLGWVYTWTGTLWTPILAHFIIDAVMGCIIRYRRDDE